MDLKLKVVEGKNAGQEVPVSGNKFFIGRAEDCHLRPGSDLISRHHCALMIEDGYVGVRDFGSKNGTYVNAERVIGEIELKPGDRLKVGPLEFEVVITVNIGGKKRPPVADLKEAATRTAAGSRSDDIDVSQWLSSGDTPGQKSPPADAKDETRRVKLSDTDEIHLETTQELQIPAASAVPEPKGGFLKKGPAKKLPPGKLPPVPESKSKDSRDAAANALDAFRKRR